MIDLDFINDYLQDVKLDLRIDHPLWLNHKINPID